MPAASRPRTKSKRFLTVFRHHQYGHPSPWASFSPPSSVIVVGTITKCQDFDRTTTLGPTRRMAELK